MTDFIIQAAAFAATTFVVQCATPAARQRHDGAISLNVRKSALPDFVARMRAEGFTVA
jgi:hypothetical protein